MELNWECCIICQKDTAEPLRCPLRGPGTSDDDNTDAYSSFLSNVEQFRAIDALPTKLYFGTASNFALHSTSWHKSCLPSDHPQNIVSLEEHQWHGIALH